MSFVWIVTPTLKKENIVVISNRWVATLLVLGVLWVPNLLGPAAEQNLLTPVTFDMRSMWNIGLLRVLRNPRCSTLEPLQGEEEYEYSVQQPHQVP